MPDDDAAAIINAASRIEVKGVDKDRGEKRDPYRTIRVITLRVLPCDQYPKGANLFIHPRQVLDHQARFPGSFVTADRTFKRDRRLNPSDMRPEGHRSIKDIVGPTRDLIRSDDE